MRNDPNSHEENGWLQAAVHLAGRLHVFHVTHWVFSLVILVKDHILYQEFWEKINSHPFLVPYWALTSRNDISFDCLEATPAKTTCPNRPPPLSLGESSWQISKPNNLLFSKWRWKETCEIIFRNPTHPPRNGNNITTVSSLLHRSPCNICVSEKYKVSCK